MSVPRELRLMLTVYGDESADDKAESVFSIGALMGTDDEWDTVCEKRRQRMGGLIFHASDLECGHGDFAGYGERERHKWYRDMVTIVADSPLVALGTALEIGMFRSVFPDAPPETPYLLCFQSVLIDFSGLSRIYLPPDDVTFVFEQNSDYEYNAAFLFDKLKKTTKWADHNRLDVVTYASKGKRIGLQPADLVAREVMKHRHNELSSKRLTRASIRGLANQHKCEFRFFTRADLELIRSRAIADWLQKTLAEYAAELGMEIANARTRGSVS